MKRLWRWYRHPWRTYRGWPRWARIVVPIIVVIAIIGAASGSKKKTPAATTTTVAAPATTQSTKTAVAAGCLPVSSSAVKAIESGLKTDNGRLTLSDAKAVKVDTHLFYVSARLHGPGLPGTTIATWSTDSISNPGVMFSVDAAAKAFSDWGGMAHGLSNPGALASRDCVG